MSKITLVESLVESDYEAIEKLAEENHGPSDIAKALQVSRRDFLHIWRDTSSRVRQCYDLGRFQIDIKKGEKLITMIEADNTTALQIHEKKAKERAFADARLQVFGV